MTDQLENWTGRQMVSDDVLRAQPAQFMQATLDHEPSLQDGDPLPPLWHWLYFLEAKRASDLGRDAHAKRGGFLPPVTLPRRMWAGGRLRFEKPLVLGKAARRTSTIKSVVQKNGRTGKLCFVTVLHTLFQDDEVAMTEEHDIVYREDPDPGTSAPQPQAAPDMAEFSETITPNQALLFRYSALTFNGHRIHYDADYARSVEGYDGLVFHGPLTATLLIDLAARQTGKTPTSFTFRGMAPIAGLAPFTIAGRQNGKSAELWAKRQDGALAMTAQAHF